MIFGAMLGAEIRHQTFSGGTKFVRIDQSETQQLEFESDSVSIGRILHSKW
jgi:hypothetical protein